jgi:hypothetical protein
MNKMMLVKRIKRVARGIEDKNSLRREEEEDEEEELTVLMRVEWKSSLLLIEWEEKKWFPIRDSNPGPQRERLIY